MLRNKITLVGLLCAVSMSALMPTLAYAQRRLYAVTFTVTSVEDGRPLRGAVVQFKGAGISAVDPDDASVSSRTGGAVQLGATGQVTAYMARGRYKVSFSHTAHKSQAFEITVPPPGSEDETNLDFELAMTMREEILARSLTVTVQGVRRGANGAETTVPLADASVEVFSEVFGTGGKSLTNGNGVVTFNRAYEIGSFLRIRASAEGYEPQEQTLVVGSRQEGAPDRLSVGGFIPPYDPNSTTRTGTSDSATFKLRKAEPSEFSLIIEAVRADNGMPIVGARVEIELIGGSQVAAGSTNVGGRTRPLIVTPLPGFSKHAQYRAKVSAPGYSEKWSDIPDDLLLFGETNSPYVVHLTPYADTKQTAADFTGDWATMTGPLGYPIAITFTQSGNEVKGTYTHRSGSGSVNGTVVGDTLTYVWTEGSRNGKGVFSISRDGQRISGGYSEEGQIGNWWNGHRRNP